MFSGESICLSVCLLDYAKTDFDEIFWMVWGVPGTQWVDFGAHTDHDPYVSGNLLKQIVLIQVAALFYGHVLVISTAIITINCDEQAVLLCCVC